MAEKNLNPIDEPHCDVGSSSFRRTLQRELNLRALLILETTSGTDDTISHSQTTMTANPEEPNSATLRASRRDVRRNFSLQNSEFEFGIVCFPHLGQPCQKQP